MKRPNTAPQVEQVDRPKTLSLRDARAKLKESLAQTVKSARGKRSQRFVAEQLELQQPQIRRFEADWEPDAPSMLHVASAAAAAPQYALQLVRWQAQQLPLFELKQLREWVDDELKRRRANGT